MITLPRWRLGPWSVWTALTDRRVVARKKMVRLRIITTKHVDLVRSSGNLYPLVVLLCPLAVTHMQRSNSLLLFFASFPTFSKHSQSFFFCIFFLYMHTYTHAHAHTHTLAFRHARYRNTSFVCNPLIFFSLCAHVYRLDVLLFVYAEVYRRAATGLRRAR